MNDFKAFGLSKKSDELRKLILENPNLPIVVLAGEGVSDGDHAWTFCGSISFGIEDILDCDYTASDDTVFVDRGSLEEAVSDDLYDDYCDKPESEYEAAVKARLNELEPFWTKVIAIYATN